MAIQLQRPLGVLAVVLLLGGCAGSGAGLDVNGNPISAVSSAPPAGSGSSAPATGLNANFQSIQDNVFTPICTKCHAGANAPEGLQLDQAHSYALLVGVPSAEVPATLRVKSGDPTNSYLIEKLQGSSGIVGVQMPFGGPYLPQSTIDVIKQWITNGAAPAATAATSVVSVSHEQSTPAALSVSATMPADGGAATAPVLTIAVGFSDPPDPSFLSGAVHLQRMAAQPMELPVLISQAEGNPATVLMTPLAPLAQGVYRMTLHGGDARGLISVSGDALPANYQFTFTVDAP